MRARSVFRRGVAALLSGLVTSMSGCAAGPGPSPRREAPPLRSARAARLGVESEAQADLLCRKVEAFEPDGGNLATHLADGLFEVDLLEAPDREVITVDFVFTQSGHVKEVRPVKVSSPAVAAAVEAAAVRARPFPRLTAPMRACFAGETMRRTLVVDGRSQCARRKEVGAFMQSVIDAVRARFDFSTLSPGAVGDPNGPPGEGHFRLLFDPAGRVDGVRIVSTTTGEIQRAVVRTVQAANPFGAPPFHAQCFEDTEQDFWLRAPR